MKDFFLWGSLALNVMLILYIWSEKHTKKIIDEYERSAPDPIKKAIYNPKPFRNEKNEK